MTDTPRPTAGGLTWDQCLSVAYEGCAEVLAKRVQELERDLAAAESRSYVRGLREALDLCRQCASDYDRDEAEAGGLDAESEGARSEAHAIAAELTARLKEAER